MIALSYKLVGDEECTYLIVHDPHHVVYRPDGEYEGYVLKGKKAISWLTSIPPNTKDLNKTAQLPPIKDCPPLWHICDGDRDLDSIIASQQTSPEFHPAWSQETKQNMMDRRHIFLKGLLEYKTIVEHSHAAKIQDIAPPGPKMKRGWGL